MVDREPRLEPPLSPIFITRHHLLIAQAALLASTTRVIRCMRHGIA